MRWRTLSTDVTLLVACGMLAAACAEEAQPIPFDAPSVATTVTAGPSVASVTTLAPLGASVASVTTVAPLGASGDSAGLGSTTVAAPTSGATTTPQALDDVGDAWVEATANLTGLSSECGNMSYVAVRPDRDMVIAGVALQGLWAIEDGGDSWTQLGQGDGSAVITNRTSAVVFDPEEPDTFWESGLYNEGGVYRTTDNGVTFERLGDVIHSDAVSIDFTDPERATMLSGLHEQPIVFRSADGGATWTDVSAGLPDDMGYAVAPYVVDAQTHLLGTRAGTAPGVFRTTDGGTTWTRVYDLGVTGQPLRASDGALYWIVEGGNRIISSADEGATWTEIGGRGVSIIATKLIELPDGRFATFGDSSVVVSDDHGGSWVAAGPPLPYEPNGLAYSPFHNAFYVWRFDCTDINDIPSNAIMRLDFAPAG